MFQRSPLSKRISLPRDVDDTITTEDVRLTFFLVIYRKIMRLFVVFILFVQLFAASIADIHRSKRFLIFPPTSPTRMQVSYSLYPIFHSFSNLN